MRQVRADLVRCAHGLCGNMDDAEDIVQDVALTMNRYYLDRHTEEDFRRIAFSVLGLKWASALYRACRRPKDVLFSELPAKKLDRLLQEAQIHRRPEGKALTILLMENGLDDLPEDQREALALIGLGLTYQETADIMGEPVTTITNWVTRGRQRIQS